MKKYQVGDIFFFHSHPQYPGEVLVGEITEINEPTIRYSAIYTRDSSRNYFDVSSAAYETSIVMKNRKLFKLVSP